jgi:hypothetical protein
MPKLPPLYSKNYASSEDAGGPLVTLRSQLRPENSRSEACGNTEPPATDGASVLLIQLQLRMNSDSLDRLDSSWARRHVGSFDRDDAGIVDFVAA